MARSQKRIEPVLKPLRDRVLFLKHNLNARALGSLTKELDGVSMNVDALVADLQKSIAEADAFISEMEKAKQADSLSRPTWASCARACRRVRPDAVTAAHSNRNGPLAAGVLYRRVGERRRRQGGYMARTGWGTRSGGSPVRRRCSRRAGSVRSRRRRRAGRPGAGAGGRGGGRGGGGGALFTAADADKDGSVTRAEFKAAFDKLVSRLDGGAGALTQEQLATGSTACSRRRRPAAAAAPRTRRPNRRTSRR